MLVIHENRGLNAHIEDVARRIGAGRLRAVAPDFLSPSGGTPANEDAARDAIGKLDLADDGRRRGRDARRARQDRAAAARSARSASAGAAPSSTGSRSRPATSSTPASSYYGPAPDPSEAAKVQAPLLIHHAGLDDRVAQTAFPWVAALRAAGKTVTYHDYDGVNHAFNNDTSAERYNKAAADLAWKRTLRFFQHSIWRIRKRPGGSPAGPSRLLSASR